MTKKLLMGNEAIALGAIRAGISVASGYPGTPSSEVLETIDKIKPGGVHVEWSVNEKAAMEVAAGAAIAGARALVTMKQVGLNVASDPLMSLNYVGVKGGMVVMAADDPGPISSQTEQDTRRFGMFAHMAVFDPSSPEEAYTMIADAFDCSEKIGRPVIFRPTTRICHGNASVTQLDSLPFKKPEGFTRDGGRWVIFPRLAYANHIETEKKLAGLADEFSSYGGNILTGDGKLGIASGGVSWSYVRDALPDGADCKLLKIGAYPFPRKLGFEFLEGLDSVLAVEELDPVIERELIYLCGLKGVKVNIRGKLSGDMPIAGENSADEVRKAVYKFLGRRHDTENSGVPEIAPPKLPPRPPVLCAGCPHRASFFAVKEAAKGRKAVFSGDIGCYTLGNAMPLDMVDTCLCMGAGITMAQGLHRIEPDAVNFAFIGDSTFFHTGMPGVLNAVYNKADIIIAVLDNSTTAMTGGQPHPGMGRTITGENAKKASIHDVLKALGAEDIQRVNAFDFEAAKAAVLRAISASGVRVIIFEGLCVNLPGAKGAPCAVSAAKCAGCAVCFKNLGCPALTMNGKRAFIEPANCTGCGLCKYLCKFGAIEGGAAL